MDWYLGVFRKYADFGGRARRKEYWMFTLFNIIAICVLAVAGMAAAAAVTDTPMLGYAPYGLYVLGTVIPGLAVTVRRLHDTGHSGWWYLIVVVPFIGAIVLLVWLCQDSAPASNQYGPNPKSASDSDFAYGD